MHKISAEAANICRNQQKQPELDRRGSRIIILIVAGMDSSFLFGKFRQNCGRLRRNFGKFRRSCGKSCGTSRQKSCSIAERLKIGRKCKKDTSLKKLLFCGLLMFYRYVSKWQAPFWICIGNQKHGSHLHDIPRTPKCT